MADDERSVYISMLDAFRVSQTKGVDVFSDLRMRVTLPSFAKLKIISLLQRAKNVISKDPSMLLINHQVITIGNLEGSIFDLFRIINDFGLPPVSRYLFLGNFIERGQFSAETAIFIILLKCLWPADVYVLRGPREFEGINAQSSFHDELRSLYPDVDIFKYFSDVFSVLPLAALVGQKTLCVHGGICPKLRTISQIEQITRPLITMNSDIIKSLMHSEPVKDNQGFVPSPRGLGFLFGQAALANFLQENNLSLLVCCKDALADGITSEFNGQMYCINTSSSWSSTIESKSAVIHLSSEGKASASVYPHFPFIQRDQCSFIPYRMEGSTSKAKWASHVSIDDEAIHPHNKVLSRSIQSIISTPKNTKSWEKPKSDLSLTPKLRKSTRLLENKSLRVVRFNNYV